MATNHYFNPFPAHQITNEQLLVEDLLIESIKQFGMDVFYIPRETRSNFDMLYGEDPTKAFKSAFAVEMYLENVTGMEGEGDIMSKFGLEIKDEITMLVSRRRFKEELTGHIRPYEGDLVYVPLFLNFFEITFVEHEDAQAMYYTLGRGRGSNVYVYALRMKQFVFAEEVIETGIEEIDDQIRDNYQRTRITLSTANGSGIFLDNEIIYQGTNVATATAQAIVYHHDVANSNVSVIRVQGTFAANVRANGNTNGASWIVSTIDTLSPMDTVTEDIVDNNRVLKEADAILDFTEHNPFGE